MSDGAAPFGASLSTGGGASFEFLARNESPGVAALQKEQHTAVREQFVRPFITGFPGNRHIAKKQQDAFTSISARC